MAERRVEEIREYSLFLSKYYPFLLHDDNNEIRDEVLKYLNILLQADTKVNKREENLNLPDEQMGFILNSTALKLNEIILKSKKLSWFNELLLKLNGLYLLQDTLIKINSNPQSIKDLLPFLLNAEIVKSSRFKQTFYNLYAISLLWASQNENKPLHILNAIVEVSKAKLHNEAGIDYNDKALNDRITDNLNNAKIMFSALGMSEDISHADVRIHNLAATYTAINKLLPVSPAVENFYQELKTYLSATIQHNNFPAKAQQGKNLLMLLHKHESSICAAYGEKTYYRVLNIIANIFFSIGTLGVGNLIKYSATGQMFFKTNAETKYDELTTKIFNETTPKKS